MANNNWDSFKRKSTDTMDSLKEKGSQVVDNLQKNKTVNQVKEAAKRNPKEAILGALMALGFIFSFYWIGSLIVGLAAALYIPYTINAVWSKGLKFYEEEGKFASFMLAVAILYLFVHTFWFVIGGLIGLTVKLFLPKKQSP